MYPKATAVIAHEINAEDDALAKLVLRHARWCMNPIMSEHKPVAPPSKPNSNMYVVDGFPPKS